MKRQKRLDDDQTPQTVCSWFTRVICDSVQVRIHTLPIDLLSSVFSFLTIRENFAVLRRVSHTFARTAVKPSAFPSTLIVYNESRWSPHTIPYSALPRLPTGVRFVNVTCTASGSDNTHSQLTHITPTYIKQLHFAQGAEVRSHLFGPALEVLWLEEVEPRLVQPAVARCLQLCPRLHTLRLHGMDLGTGWDLKPGAAPGMRHLSLSLDMETHNHMDERSLSALISALPNLYTIRLELHHTAVNGFALLRELRELKEVIYAGQQAVTADMLCAWEPASRAHLRKLHITNVSVNKRAMVHLTQNSNLEELTLSTAFHQTYWTQRQPDSDTSVTEFKGTSALRVLHIQGADLWASGLKELLLPWPALRHLVLFAPLSKITFQGQNLCEHIVNMLPSLTTLRSSLPMSDLDCAQLSKHAALQKLELSSGTFLTEECVAHFRALRGLRELRVGRVRISKEQVESFIQERADKGVLVVMSKHSE